MHTANHNIVILVGVNFLWRTLRIPGIKRPPHSAHSRGTQKVLWLMIEGSGNVSGCPSQGIVRCKATAVGGGNVAESDAACAA